MTEREAEDEVLRICRSGRCKDSTKSQDGIWCMRILGIGSPKSTNGDHAVIDNARWSAPIIAQGKTWVEVLEKLP